MDKFAPKKAPKKLELKMEFNKCVLKNASQDPDEWITNLESIKSRLEDMSSIISDEDFLIHILNNLPKEYEVQQSKLEDHFDNTSDPLTVEDVRSELNLMFMRMNKSQVSTIEDESDKALAGMGKKVKTKCTQCGKIGHKKEKCWEIVGKPEKKGGQSKFTGECFYCKKVGHREVDCFAKKRDQGKQNDSANVGIQTGRDVVLMATEATPDTSTWIADSGATSHITNDDTGMYEWKMVNLPITVGDGSRWLQILAACLG